MSDGSVGIYCPNCSHYAIHPVPSETVTVGCAACSHEVTLNQAANRPGSLDACPLCKNREFYSKKDLPQQVGCAVVALTIITSSLAYAFWGVLASFAVLALASLLDFALYHRLRDAVVCYRCQAELRGVRPLDGVRPFDIGRAEEYEEGRSG